MPLCLISMYDLTYYFSVSQGGRTQFSSAYAQFTITFKICKLWCQFFARVKVNHRSICYRILARMCTVAMAMELVKNKASKMVFVYLKRPSH